MCLNENVLYVCFCVSQKGKKHFFLPMVTAGGKLSVIPCMFATDYLINRIP
jgi:hypothetical protein